jgi:hypothetical protein
VSSVVGAVVAWFATIWVTALGTFAARIAQFAEKHPNSGRTTPSGRSEWAA